MSYTLCYGIKFYTVPHNLYRLFLLELRQISTNFCNSWQFCISKYQVNQLPDKGWIEKLQRVAPNVLPSRLPLVTKCHPDPYHTPPLSS